MRIYLVGFMGSGKSVLGSRVAQDLQVSFVDIDQVIESQAGMSIANYFEAFGEDDFRELEHDVLMQTAFYPKALISTGGGLPCFHDNMDWMLTHGITVYLEWPESYLVDHVRQLTPVRPLLQGLSGKALTDRIRHLLEVRKPVYERAAITVEMEGELEKDREKLENVCTYIW